MIRRLQFGRFGLKENPVGAIVRYQTREGYALREVTGVYHRESPAGFMLRVRSFDRTLSEEVSAGAVELILPDPQDFTEAE